MKDWITPINQAQEELDEAKVALNRGARKAFAGRIEDTLVVLEYLLEQVKEDIDKQQTET